MNENMPSLPTATTPTHALFRFCLNSGARLVQRVFLPFFGSFLAIYFFFGHDFFQAFTAALIGGGYLSSAVPSTLFLLVIAGIAGRRISSGMTGWIRHLPIPAKTTRQIVVAAIWLAILPALCVPVALAVAAAAKYDIRLIPYLPGLVLAGLAAAFYVLPVKRGLITKICLILACLFYTAQNWILFFSGCLLHLLGIHISGPLNIKIKRMRYEAGRLLDFLLIWRALRVRLFIPYFFSLMVFPILFLVLSGNSLHAHQVGMVVRLSAGISLTLFCAAYAQILFSRRPHWLWRRSLPDSARNRLFKDGIFLLVQLFPLVIVFAVIRFRIIAFILVCLPPLVVVSVMGGRRITAGRFGVFGWICGQTILPILLFGLSPWVSLPFLALVPWLLNRAVFVEKTLMVSSWQDVTHFAVGDGQSWREN